MIYLYLKTHNKTGLKYLGKTISNDPYSYQGSGKVWRRHISKHGYDVTTEILLETDDKVKLKDAGIFYSNLWNIVESKDFANLIQESGEGGAMPWTKENRQNLSNALKGKSHTDISKHNFSKAQQKRSSDISKEMKEYLSIPENYEKRCKQLSSMWDIPGHRETQSKRVSSLKWCNDGFNNYRKLVIPVGMFAGKKVKLFSHIKNKI